MTLDHEGKWNRRMCHEPLAYVCSKDKRWCGKVQNVCKLIDVVLPWSSLSLQLQNQRR